MLIRNEHAQGKFFWMSRSTNLSGNGTTTSVIWIFLLVFSIMISQEETDRPSSLMVFLLLSLFKCDVVKQRHILTPFFTSGHFLRNLIFSFIFDQSWQDYLDSITLVTSASYEALSRKVFCVVIGIPKHRLAVIEQEFNVSVRFFFKKALPTSSSHLHSCPKIISVFWGATNFKWDFRVVVVGFVTFCQCSGSESTRKGPIILLYASSSRLFHAPTDPNRLKPKLHKDSVM